MSLNITYKLVGTGWSECTLRDDAGSECTVSASYLSDALGNLVLAALAIGSGFKSASFSFDEEPGEYRWVIEQTDLNVVRIRILSFPELWGGKPNEQGQLLFSASCRPIVFAAEVLRMASELLEECGEDGYMAQWVEHRFPIRELSLLREFVESRNEG
jgi:hypothetical protein